MNTETRQTKITKAQAAYLTHFVDGPAYASPYGINQNTMHGALRNGLVEKVEGTTQVRLTEKGRKALGL